MSDPISELDLSHNRLNAEDINGILRACYNHKFYPLKSAQDGNIPLPFYIDIRGNPVVATQQVPVLLDNIRKDGGKERVSGFRFGWQIGRFFYLFRVLATFAEKSCFFQENITFLNFSVVSNERASKIGFLRKKVVDFTK